ncbi:hypothetical protein LJC56_10000 [Christensenellaceae bacterium OttesenSCG-928-K19]|nr:hypothetical protein [Christensenellaceae bacterium OttesenSCG-928-K19]
MSPVNNQKLNTLEQELDNIQLTALELIRNNLKSAKKALNRLQLKDMSRVVEMDISCRTSLHEVSAMVDRVDISEETYSVFMMDSALILAELSTCDIPPQVKAAYDTIHAAIQANERLAAPQVFTVISIIVTVVALCLPSLSPDKQPDVIQELDRLLEIKSNQLNLMQQMARWHNDFLN